MNNNQFWDSRYNQSPELYGVEPNQYFKQKIKLLQPGRLLIPGEGEGRQAVYAARLGWEVTAFDMSSVAREHALGKAQLHGLKLDYYHSTAEDFSYGNEYYDTAALIYFHLPPALRVEAHKKIAASVKRGGYLIIEAFHPKQLDYSSGGPRSEEMLYTDRMLQSDFEDWEVIETREEEVVLSEGIGHSGTGYVTRLFARKDEQ